MPRHSRQVRIALLAVTLALVTGSCDRSPVGPSRTPLYGLRYAGLTDSLGRGIPLPPSPQGSGIVTGTVIGPSAPGAGNDGPSNAPRVANVTIGVYPVVSDADPAAPKLGPVVATETTSNDGRFTMPLLEATALGYVFTFTPPSGSVHSGGWVRSNVWVGSLFSPWWVRLPLK